jgi:hypothetical protein
MDQKYRYRIIQGCLILIAPLLVTDRNADFRTDGRLKYCLYECHVSRTIIINTMKDSICINRQTNKPQMKQQQNKTLK